MSENEKMPTDAAAPAETTAAPTDSSTPAETAASATPAAAEPSAAEQRGEAIGERLASLEAEEKAAAATPEGEKADRKKHVGVIVAAVVFAVLLIGGIFSFGRLGKKEDAPFVIKTAVIMTR